MKVRQYKKAEKTRMISIRLPVSAYERIKKEAAQERRTVHGTIVAILDRRSMAADKKITKLTDALSALLDGLLEEDSTPPQ